MKNDKNNHVPISKETEANLIKIIELSIDDITKSIDIVRHLIRKLDLLTIIFEKNNLGSEISTVIGLRNMLEYRMLIGIIFLDLASATRAYFNSKFTYEKLFSTRQIIVIINEGYKQVYNFIILNKVGDTKTTNRNNSFWYKEVGNFVKESLPKLVNEYDLLTRELDNYFDDHFSSIKEQRDLSVHYDKKASKVYDMSINLDIDEIFKKLSPFLQLLNEMFQFTGKMVDTFQEKEKIKCAETNKQLYSLFTGIKEKVESAKTKENDKAINKLLEMISKAKNDLI